VGAGRRTLRALTGRKVSYAYANDVPLATWWEEADRAEPARPKNAGQIPGFVFDDLADPPEGNHIPYGHPMEKLARVDGYGVFRRPTPQR
jgi:hypothetical protein